MQKVRDVCRNDWNKFSKMLLKNFHENYSDLFKKNNMVWTQASIIRDININKFEEISVCSFEWFRIYFLSFSVFI